MTEASRADGKLIVAFDLDDTLFPQEDHVHSGLRVVARAIHERFGFDVDDVFVRLRKELFDGERGRVFDSVLDQLGVRSKPTVRWLVKQYRHHDPVLQLPLTSERVLARLADRPLYVVTDGHKVVQDKKLTALGLRPRFRHCYITHRYGVRHAKPSAHVFRLLLARERCTPADVVYVGDNPHKDFQGIRPLGFRTIRVLTGPHAGVQLDPELDAEIHVASLAEVPEIVAAWEQARPLDLDAPQGDLLKQFPHRSEDTAGAPRLRRA